MGSEPESGQNGKTGPNSRTESKQPFARERGCRRFGLNPRAHLDTSLCHLVSPWSLTGGLIRALPDFNFGFELDTHPFGHPVTDDINELQYIFGRGAALGDKKIGVTLADFGAAHLLAFEAALVDQHTRAHPARILKNTAGIFVGHRQIGFLDDPLFLHSFGNNDRVFPFQLEFRGENYKLVQAAFAVSKHEVAAFALDDFATTSHYSCSTG